VLHSHYPRNPTDAEETEATLRAYIDTGLRVGFAASLFTRNFFSYDDAAFLKILPADLRERATRVGREGATGAERFFAEVRRLTARHAGIGQGAAAVRILHGPVAPQWVTPEELARCRREADELGGGIQCICSRAHISAPEPGVSTGGRGQWSWIARESLARTSP
jgi:hypothetical protein